MVSMKDVAKKANVAKSTVSLVINNSGYVSEETRKKVEEAMKELNYMPNRLAKNFSSQRSHIIGVVVPDIMHPFFSNFVKYLEKDLYEQGYMTMVCSTLGREHVELEYLNWLKQSTMDGIVMCSHSLSIQHYIDAKKPLVSLDRFLNEDIPVVSSDHYSAAKITIEKLRENSCRRVVQFIGSSNANIEADDYARYCKQLFNRADEEIIFHKMPINTFSLSDYFRAASQAFLENVNVDAFVGTDMVMNQCLKISRQKNIQVPEKLKLISYDGTQVTGMTYPEISTVVQPIESLAHKSAELIIRVIEGEEITGKFNKNKVTWRQGGTTF